MNDDALALMPRNGDLAPMRILYVQNEFPVVSQTFVSNEIRGLIAAGDDVRVLSLNRSSVNLYIEDLPTSSIRDVPIVRALVSHWQLFSRAPRAYGTFLSAAFSSGKAAMPWVLWVPYFVLAIWAEKVDHVHTHFATRAAAFAAVLCRAAGVSRSVTTHASDIYGNRPHLDKQLRGAELATVTAFNQALLREKGYATAHLVRCGVALSPVPPADFSESEVDHFLERFTSKQLVVSVGRCVTKKGHSHLIRAMSLLREAGVDADCVIVGDGPLFEAHRALAERLHSPVHMVGARSSAFVDALLRRADVFALACIVDENGDADGLPVVFLEAASHRVPVVAGDVTGVRELIDDRTGWRVDGSQEEALAQAIRQALTDGTAVSNRTSACYERVRESFTIDAQVRGIRSVFRSAHQVS